MKSGRGVGTTKCRDGGACWINRRKVRKSLSARGTFCDTAFLWCRNKSSDEKLLDDRCAMRIIYRSWTEREQKGVIPLIIRRSFVSLDSTKEEPHAGVTVEGTYCFLEVERT